MLIEDPVKNQDFFRSRKTALLQVKTANSKKPIRVLHIIDAAASSYIFDNLCDYTNWEEVEHTFITFRDKDSDFVKDMKKRGVRVYALDTPNRRQYPSGIKQIWKIIKSEKPDIVHTHIFDPTLLGVTLAKLCGIKAVVTRHHTDTHHVLSSPLKRKFYLGLESYINFLSDHMIALSRFGRELLIEKENVPEQKVSLIPNGQSAKRFEAITPEAIAQTRADLGMNDKLALVCTSRLYHGKGHIYLFEALAPLIKNGLEATLYLVGEGAYREQLEKFTVELGIQDQVRFLGWRKDALTIIAAADLIVHPSLEDALSSAVIESLMLARPIIASDISGVQDILDDGKYGVIVPPADSSAMREAIEQTIANLAAAQEKATAGRAYILDNMGAERFAREYANCYRKVLNIVDV